MERCTVSAVAFGTSGVSRTLCVEHFRFASVTAPAGFVDVRTQLTEFTAKWQAKEKARAGTLGRLSIESAELEPKVKRYITHAQKQMLCALA